MCWKCDLTAPRCGWASAKKLEDYFAGWSTENVALTEQDYTDLGLKDVWESDFSADKDTCKAATPQEAPKPHVRAAPGACICACSESNRFID